MQVIMMGTGPFAVPTFRALYDTPHTIVALVTGPLRTHRGKSIEPVSLIREVAGEHGTAIFDPEDVNSPEAQAELTRLSADLLIVCDYGQILSPGTLATAPLGGINLHASLLPKYRGAAPINWAIYNGDTETGVTIIHMAPRVDAGPSIAQTHVPIGPDETAAELEPRLAEIGAGLVCEAIRLLESGAARPIPQDASSASRAPRLKKTDGAIDWSRPAAAIKNQIRALEPWPKTYTFWHRAGGPSVRLIPGPASVVPGRAEPATPGAILEASGDRLVIAAGNEALMPASIQPSGKRLMPVAEFLRGYHIQVGDRLAPEE